MPISQHSHTAESQVGISAGDFNNQLILRFQAKTWKEAKVETRDLAWLYRHCANLNAIFVSTEMYSSTEKWKLSSTENGIGCQVRFLILFT